MLIPLSSNKSTVQPRVSSYPYKNLILVFYFTSFLPTRNSNFELNVYQRHRRRPLSLEKKKRSLPDAGRRGRRGSWRWYRGWLRNRLRPGTKRIVARHRRFARVETGRLGPDIHDAATSCGRLALQCRSPCKAAPALELRVHLQTPPMASGLCGRDYRLSTEKTAFILLLARSYILYHRFLINSSRSEPVSRLIHGFVPSCSIRYRLIELTECIAWQWIG